VRGPPSRRALVANTGTLFGAQLIAMVAPLLTVPYLARTLGPDGWAPVVFAQALGNWLVVLLDYGFDLAGPRAVAQARTRLETMSDVVAQVQGAKLLLVPAAVLITVAAFAIVPSMRDGVRLLAWTLVFAVCRGLNPFWFFQGIEEVRVAAFIEALTKGAAAIAVLYVVTVPGDGWRVLALQGAFAALSMGVLTWMMSRRVTLRRPDIRAALSMLHGTSRLFAMRAASSVYNQASVLILATMASAAAVSYFGGAERIVRAAIALMLLPLTQVLLPRLSFLSASDPRAARRLLDRCLVVIGMLGAIGGIVSLLAAPLLVRLLLGPGFGPAADVIRVLAPLPLAIAINTVLAFYWAVPFGHDRRLLLSVLWAGAANIALALLFVPRWGAAGMAASVVGAELVMMAQLAWAYGRHRGALVPAGVQA
jgi:polysaccharide transporter, PST family